VEATDCALDAKFFLAKHKRQYITPVSSSESISSASSAVSGKKEGPAPEVQREEETSGWQCGDRAQHSLAKSR